MPNFNLQKTNKTSVSVAKVRSIKFGGIGEDTYVYREIRKAFESERKETCVFFVLWL